MVNVRSHPRRNWTRIQVNYYGKWKPAYHSFDSYVVGGPAWEKEEKKFPDRFWSGSKGLMLSDEWLDYYITERPDLMKGEPRVLSEAEAITELVEDIVPRTEPNVCVKEGGGFFLNFEPEGKSPKLVPAPEVMKKLFEGLKEAGRNIFDFNASQFDLQTQILSELAGRPVYGWRLEPAMVTISSKCPGCSLCKEVKNER